MAATATAFIPLAEAAKQIPGRPHVSTLHRWANRGVNGVRLETQRVGNRRFTTQTAIDQFLAELNQSDADRLAAEGC